MKTFMDLAELLIGNVGINLRRRDRGMAEQSLNRTDISPVSQKIGRERMAQGMRADMFSNDSGHLGVFLHGPLN